MLNTQHAELLKRIRTGMTHGGDAVRLEQALQDEYQAGYLAGHNTRASWGAVFFVTVAAFAGGVTFAAAVVFPVWAS